MTTTTDTRINTSHSQFLRPSTNSSYPPTSLILRGVNLSSTSKYPNLKQKGHTEPPGSTREARDAARLSRSGVQSRLSDEEGGIWSDAEAGGYDGWFVGHPFVEDEADVSSLRVARERRLIGLDPSEEIEGMGVHDYPVSGDMGGFGACWTVCFTYATIRTLLTPSLGESMMKRTLTTRSASCNNAKLIDFESVRPFCCSMIPPDLMRSVISPHQDVFSRFLSGSGAPIWVLIALGLNPRRIHQTSAAVIHSSWATEGYGGEEGIQQAKEGKDEKFPDSRASLSARASLELTNLVIWNTNLNRLAARHCFTMIWASHVFAPKCRIDGLPASEWLGERFRSAYGQQVWRDDCLLISSQSCRQATRCRRATGYLCHRLGLDE